MRPTHVTALLVLVALAGCKKPSALEETTDSLPSGSEPLSPNEVRAYISRENAKRQKQNRAEPGANQVNAINTSSGGGSAPPDAGQAEPPPSGQPEPQPTEQPAVARNDGPWSGAMVEFDGSFILLKGRIDFGSDGKSVVGDGVRVIADLVSLLQERPSITTVEVGAHVHNKQKGAAKLTQKRANAIRDYIVSGGIDSSRIVAVGYGDEMPIDTNRTEDGRRANERIEVLVKSINGAPL